jgi:RNA polymerase sigma-70 factor, ECF subfamily
MIDSVAINLSKALLGALAKMLEDITASSNVSLTAAGDLDDVDRSKNGDGQAYKRIIESHQQAVSKLMWRFSRDRRMHEELVQDVFVEAYLSLKSFKGTGAFENWLAKIATRVGYRYWKENIRQNSIASLSSDDFERLAQKNIEKIDAGKAALIVHELLSQLGPRDRLVLTLRYLQQCTIEETAKRTGWSKVMVKVQTWRAIGKLEKILKDIKEEK